MSEDTETLRDYVICNAADAVRVALALLVNRKATSVNIETVGGVIVKVWMNDKVIECSIERLL